MSLRRTSFLGVAGASALTFFACGSSSRDTPALATDVETGASIDAASGASPANDATLDSGANDPDAQMSTVAPPDPGGDDSTPTAGDDDDDDDVDAGDTDADCFDRASSAKLPFAFLQQAQAPLVDGGDYPLTSPNYPASIYAFGTTAGMTKLSPAGASGDAFTKMAWEWSNRCLYIRGVTPTTTDCRNGTGDEPASGDAGGTLHPVATTKANWYFGVVTPPAADGGKGEALFAGFSTYTKAHACTHLQIEHALGVDMATLASEATNAGLSLVVGNDVATLTKLAETVQIYRKTSAGDAWSDETMMVDQCIVEANVPAFDSDGIVLDHELQDFPTAAENSAYLQGLHELVAATGKKLLLYTNSLATYAGGPASSATANGFTSASTRALLGVVDGFSPIVWSGATAGDPDRSLSAHARGWSYPENYQAQVAYITGTGAPLTAAEKAKILFGIALSDLDVPQNYLDGGSPGPNAGLPEALFLHAAIASGGFAGIDVWKNYATTGGACSRPDNQVIACLAFGACDGGYTGH